MVTTAVVNKEEKCRVRLHICSDALEKTLQLLVNVLPCQFEVDFDGNWIVSVACSVVYEERLRAAIVGIQTNDPAFITPSIISPPVWAET